MHIMHNVFRVHSTVCVRHWFELVLVSHLRDGAVGCELNGTLQMLSLFQHFFVPFHLLALAARPTLSLSLHAETPGCQVQKVQKDGVQH